jgi:hypothetical protein
VEGRAKGLILVLVVDESRIDDPHASIARVCRDFDIADIDELAGDLAIAAAQAANQVRLRAAMLGLLARAS